MREGRASARDAARARIAEQEVVVGAHGQGVGAALLVSALRHGISPPRTSINSGCFCATPIEQHVFRGDMSRIAPVPGSRVGGRADAARRTLPAGAGGRGGGAAAGGGTSMRTTPGRGNHVDTFI